MRSARSPWLLVGVFLSGAALGWGALSRGATPSVTPLGETSDRDSRWAESPRTEESHDGAAPPIDASGASLRPAPTLAPATSDADKRSGAGLAARMADFDRTLRRRVAQAARDRLGQDLPEDYLGAAVQLAEHDLEQMPGKIADGWVARQRARAALGELTDPWEVVVTGRTGGSLRIDARAILDARPEARAQLGLGEAPVDALSPVTLGERNAVRWQGGAALPVGKALVIESVEVDGVLGVPGQAHGGVGVSFAGVRIPPIAEQGVVHGRFVGVAVLAAPRGGTGTLDLSVDLSFCAARIVVRGRLIDESQLRSAPAVRFHAAASGTDGYLTGAPVKLQIVVGHGGGNPCRIDLLGAKNGYVRTLSRTPIWDDGPQFASQNDSRAFSDGAGAVPGGKAFRIRRVDWRVRFAAGTSSHGQFLISAGGHDLVSLSRSDLREPGQSDRFPETSRAGSWSGDVLVQGGNEESAVLECAYYVMGEAVFWGELVDLPK